MAKRLAGTINPTVEQFAPGCAMIFRVIRAMAGMARGRIDRCQWRRIRVPRIQPGNPACRVANRPAGWLLLACLALSGWHAPAARASEDIVLVGDTGHAAHRQFIDGFRGELPGVGVHVIGLDALDGIRLEKVHTDLVVSVGSRAAHAVLSRPLSMPVIAGMIPRATYSKLAATDVRHTALFIDQPLERRIRLARAVAPDARRIGMFARAGNLDLKREIARLAPGLRERLVIRWLANRDLENIRLYKRLNEGLEGMDVLVAIPDRRIYNRKTVRTVLIGSFRRRIPVVGFSRSFTRAGALASIHSRPEDLASQAADMVKTWLERRELPQPRFPARFSVSTNDAVARSLGIELPSDAALEAITGGRDEQ